MAGGLPSAWLPRCLDELGAQAVQADGVEVEKGRREQAADLGLEELNRLPTGNCVGQLD